MVISIGLNTDILLNNTLLYIGIIDTLFFFSEVSEDCLSMLVLLNFIGGGVGGRSDRGVDFFI